MRPDLLQQLRDIHPPPVPDWWPPAPGWWLLAALAAAAVALLIRYAWAAWRRRQPIRRARALHAELVRRHGAGALDDRAYVDACNELLKRLFVHGLQIDAARPVADERWLAMLDAALGEPAFSQGPGRSLGEARFAPAANPDVAALAALVTRLLARIGPRVREHLP